MQPPLIRKLFNNGVDNGNFEKLPLFVAPQTGTGWIDGTATGNAVNQGFGWHGAIVGSGNVRFDDTMRDSGSASLKISTTGISSYIEVRNGGVGYSGAFGQQLLPNTRYRLKYRMKTNYVSGDSNSGAVVQYLMSTAGGTTANLEFGSTPIKNTTDWTTYTVDFVTNSVTAWGHPELRIYGHTGAGTLIMDAWFDYVSIEQLGMPFDANIVQNGLMESYPTFVAPTTASLRWIDGTAGGGLVNLYKWAFRSGLNSASAQFDTANAYSGASALKLSTLIANSFIEVCNYRESGNPTSASQADLIPVKPLTTYKISCYMKTNYVSGDSLQGAGLYFAEYGSGFGSPNVGQDLMTPVKVTQGYTYYETTFTTTAGGYYLSITPKIYGHTGTATLIMDAWFDEIMVCETPILGNSNVEIPAPALRNASAKALSTGANANASGVSFSGKIKLGVANNTEFVRHWFDGTSESIRLNIEATTGKPFVWVVIPSLTGYATKMSVGGMKMDTWYQIGYTYQNISGFATVILYVNGVQVAISTGQTLCRDTNGDVNINPPNPSSAMKDCRFFNGVLTATDMYKLYLNSQAPVSVPDMVNWECRENIGNTLLLDKSGNGFDGTFTGTPAYKTE